MQKVIVLINENNKEKFISKGIAYTLKKFGFFVYEIKIIDINLEAINKISPDLFFIFWTKYSHSDVLENLICNISSNCDFVHISEFNDYIPKKYKDISNHYFFAPDSKTKLSRYYLPVNTYDYKCNFEDYRYNITFAGNPYKRENVLAEIIKHFGEINIFSRSFDFFKSIEEIEQQHLLDEFELKLYKKSYKGFIKNTKDLGEVFVSTKVNIDILSDRPKEINYRLREITASGGFALVPYTESVVNQYEDGIELETYKDNYELIDKIDFYLHNINIAQNIAINGKKNTISNYSCRVRLKDMLKVIYGKNFSSR